MIEQKESKKETETEEDIKRINESKCINGGPEKGHWGGASTSA